MVNPGDVVWVRTGMCGPDTPGIDLAALARVLAETPDAADVLGNLIATGVNCCESWAAVWEKRKLPSVADTDRRSAALGLALLAVLEGSARDDR